MAKIHISIAVFLCILALGQKLVSAETCSLQLGCTTSDFACWYDCKNLYHGNGGCTNKDFVLSRPDLLPSVDGGEGTDDEGFCCKCACKFESDGACPNGFADGPSGAKPPK